MSGDIGGKGYAPLPQSISNTDTEDEDEDHHQEEMNNPIPKGHGDIRLPDATILCKNGRFYPLDETKNLTNHIRNGRSSFAYSNDDIPIMMLDGQAHNDLWKRRDMSPLRRLCLVMSILLCIFTILIFLYVLPCDNSVICPSLSEPKSSVSWDKTLDGVELHGPISIIPGSPDSLIFLRRGQQFGKSSQVPLPGGVLSMNSIDGIPLWLVPLKRLPINIDCENFDINGSGKPDCLVSGKEGLLISIEPISGTVHWNSVVSTHPDLPLRLPDIDSDKIQDLLTVEMSINDEDYVLNLVLLSGRKGSLLLKHQVQGCQNIKLEYINSNFDLSYLCYDTNKKKTTKIISLKHLIESLNNSHVQQKFSNNQYISSYPKHNLNQTWDLTPYHRLYVQNQGDCPGENCQANVNLMLRNTVTKESRSIWNISSNSFAAQPAILNNIGHNDTTGFVLRFWHWTEPPKTETTESGSTLIQQTLTERVLIVLMNFTNVHVLNASQRELIQFCHDTDCQPNLERQANSISVVDLNDDGMPELISYRSTYSILEEEKSLSSIVQVVKLSEIFKLKLR